MSTEPFPKRQILDSSKLKEFAGDNFKFDENGRKFSKRLENTVGKRRNCSLRAISPFPTVFSKEFYCRQVKSRICFGMGRKHCGKRRNCSLRAISPFPTVFSKEFYCRQVKSRICFGWVENTVGKGEIARYEQFLLFPQCFQKNSFADK